MKRPKSRPLSNNMGRMAVVLVTAATVLTLSGCQKEPETIEEIKSDVIQVMHDESIPNVLKMTREEINEMSIQEFQSSIKEWLPSWRSYFKVPDTYVVTEKDWEEFRYLLCMQLFGPEVVEEAETVVGAQQFAEEVAGIDVEEDPDWIYKAPSRDLLERMTPAEFREYYLGLYVYLEKDKSGWKDREEMQKRQEKRDKLRLEREELFQKAEDASPADGEEESEEYLSLIEKLSELDDLLDEYYDVPEDHVYTWDEAYEVMKEKVHEMTDSEIIQIKKDFIGSLNY